MIVRPSYYPSWTQGTDEQVANPPQSLRQTGFVPGQPPAAQHFNALLYDLGQWVEYLDQSQNGAVLATTLDASVRLVGGGTLSYTAATNTLAWSAPLYVSVPSIPDADNAIAAGQISVPDGSIAYVQANIPFSATGDVVSGNTTVQNVSYTLGIQVGQTATGANIPAGTTVVAVEDTSVTLSQAPTGTQSAQALTFSGVGPLTMQVAPLATFVPSANTVVLARGFKDYIFVGANAQVAVLHNLEQRMLMEPGYLGIVRAPAGQAITQSQAVYISQDASGTRTAGNVYPTDASSTNGATRAHCLGFALQAAAAGATCSVVTGGYLPGFTGLAPGKAVWLDPATPGGITQTLPAIATTPYVVRTGLAVTANTIAVRPEHVPDGIFPTVQANSVVSGAGFRDTFGPAYLTSGTVAGTNGNYTFLVCGTGSTAYFVPTSDGSLVGLSFSSDTLAVDTLQLYFVVMAQQGNTVLANGPGLAVTIGSPFQTNSYYARFSKGQIKVYGGSRYALAVRYTGTTSYAVSNLQGYATFEAGA